jgi:ketosteroid isomerase-like protein
MPGAASAPVRPDTVNGGDTMQEIERLTAKLDIQEMAAKYAHYCDHASWDQVVDLYTDDGVFDASTVYGKVYRGRAELLDFYENAPSAVAHHPTSQFTDVRDDATASTSMKMIVLFHRQAFSIDYQWELAQAGNRWKITQQTISVVGKVTLGAEKVTA